MQNTIRRCGTGSLFLLLFCFFCAPDGDARRYAKEPDKQTSASHDGVVEAVQKHFGAAVEVVTAFQPFNVLGDFNGDGAVDIVVVVRIKARRNVLPKDVKILNPFETRGAVKFPTKPESENRLALAIIHSWKSAATSGKFLLLGESPILIMQYSRATSNELADKQKLIDMMSKRGRRPLGVTLPRGSKGDVILLGTEVGGDSLLYWNGRTYLWEDSGED